MRDNRDGDSAEVASDVEDYRNAEETSSRVLKRLVELGHGWKLRQSAIELVTRKLSEDSWKVL